MSADAQNPERVFVAIGTNLGDRLSNIEVAVEKMRSLPRVHMRSAAHTYETPALLAEGDTTPQPNYLNTVVELSTWLEPEELLKELKTIERDMGRTTSTRWAARVIDLDIVLWGARVVNNPTLTIPHPEMHRRRFVLEPLAEIGGDVVHPHLGVTVHQLLVTVLRGDK